MIKAGDDSLELPLLLLLLSPSLLSLLPLLLLLVEEGGGREGRETGCGGASSDSSAHDLHGRTAGSVGVVRGATIASTVIAAVSANVFAAAGVGWVVAIGTTVTHASTISLPVLLLLLPLPISTSFLSRARLVELLHLIPLLSLPLTLLLLLEILLLLLLTSWGRGAADSRGPCEREGSRLILGKELRGGGRESRSLQQASAASECWAPGWGGGLTGKGGYV